MNKNLLLVLFISLALGACKKCVECEIRLKESQDVIGFVDEYCGTNKQVKEEQDRLRADYTCIECSVTTGLGQATSGLHCGDRTFTDSLEAAWDAGVFDLGTTANCIYYRDTVNVACVLVN